MAKRLNEKSNISIDYEYAKSYAFSCTRYRQEERDFRLERMKRVVQRVIEERAEKKYRCTVEEMKTILGYLNHSDLLNQQEGRALKDQPTTLSATELLNAGQYASDHDLVRYLVYRYKFKNYPREKKLNDFPIVLAVEPTSICNLRCVMCFQADSTFTKDKSQMGLMDFGLYKQIIDEAAEAECASLVLASRGEPMLHPKFPEMVSYAKEKKILDIKINTNATKLTADKARQILKSEPNVIVFSVDSSNKEEFEEIRIGASFDEVVENIRTFNEIREKEFPNSVVRTRISMLLMNPEQDAEKAREFWGGLVDEFAVKGTIQRLDVYSLGLVEISDPCALLWERLYIWWDGKINPCDSDYKSHLSPGSIGNGASIRSIWLGEAMNHYRKLHATGLKNSISPCSHCDGYCL